MASERAPRDRYAHVDAILRFFVATSFLFAYCTVVLWEVAAIYAERSRQEGRSLSSMIGVTLGLLSLLPHLATLAIGYRRWHAMSMARWGIASTVAGLLCPLVWRMTGGFVEPRYPAGNWTLLLSLTAAGIVLLTGVLFELMLRTGQRRTA